MVSGEYENLKVGKIKLFSRRGFGFIIPKDRGPEVFFHGTVLDASLGPQLAPGKSVLYLDMELEDGRRRATYVRALDLVLLAREILRHYDNKEYEKLIETVEKLRLILE